MKDRDFHKNVLLPEDVSIRVWNQLKADTKFLEQSQVMDYSLMLGIYNVGLDSSHIYSSDWVFAPLYGVQYIHIYSFKTNRYQSYQAPKLQTASRLRLDAKPGASRPKEANSVVSSSSSTVPEGLHPALAPMWKPSSDLKLKDLGVPQQGTLPEEFEDEQTFRQVKTAGYVSTFFLKRDILLFFAISIYYKRADALLQGNEDMRIVQDHKSTMKAELIEGPGFYCIGIIDILQDWNHFKRFERFYKVHLCCDDGDGLSCMEPTMYRKRFLSKMLEVGFGPKKRNFSDKQIKASDDIHSRPLPPATKQNDQVRTTNI
ncbi:G-protein-coupled receptor family protein [Reticulomyxa filosa]|uniref:G-protein-coupled receptor family protein n=1 Tax=Reticulomyxa filosa TaxID=46433 RepID=X6M518_RETFI|nr:G-protein-coupled receptor family protein [Reticulomyxa filosa]|eukprot:ETO08999.1 G-protein-coupled receptor family protein [Reticulomyxa filosa]